MSTPLVLTISRILSKFTSSSKPIRIFTVRRPGTASLSAASMEAIRSGSRRSPPPTFRHFQRGGVTRRDHGERPHHSRARRGFPRDLLHGARTYTPFRRPLADHYPARCLHRRHAGLRRV